MVLKNQSRFVITTFLVSKLIAAQDHMSYGNTFKTVIEMKIFMV